jgi:adenine-specific DNA methylase
MLKRLIEVALPLKEISDQSAREKSVRHGHISTLHIWWARRPLAACRAAVFASLIPDPDDPTCPESFRTLVRKLLNRNEFIPKDGDGSPTDDTPRNRCLEFIKYLVRWENSNNAEYIEPARKLIAAAHKLLQPGTGDAPPKVLDPFSGGGAIPLEAQRLGCNAQAFDLNPVAHLLELCTLVYPQTYGQPESRPVPEYIKQLIAHNRALKKTKGQDRPLLPKDDIDKIEPTHLDKVLPNVQISEAEYRKNPLAADVKYWGSWVLECANRDIGHFYPKGPNGNKRLAYLWAHTLPCPNPSCGVAVPLIKQMWLANTPRKKAWLVLIPKPESIQFEVRQGALGDYDPSQGTIRLGAMRCPVCEQGVYDKSQIKTAAKRGLGLMPLCLVTAPEGEVRSYELFTATDKRAFVDATALWNTLRTAKCDGLTTIPDELIGRDYEWVLKPPMFGLTTWGDQFNPRQGVAMATFAKYVRLVADHLDREYAVAVCSMLTLVVGRLADKCAIQCVWNGLRENLEHVFGRQAIPMSWDYGEVNPFSEEMGGWLSNLDWVLRCVESLTPAGSPASVHRGSATRLPMEADSLDAVITDPPYYDAVPYADLSDFFYIWHKRCLRGLLPDLYRTPVTPKTEELVEQSNKVTPAERRKKTKGFFEAGMRNAFAEICRVLRPGGIGGVMFAHSSTAAWEALIGGMLASGIYVVSSWPLHTERKGRLRANNSAALASSILLICRKREEHEADEQWDNVRRDLKRVSQERLAFFWAQGIRGADFFIWVFDRIRGKRNGVIAGALPQTPGFCEA